MSMKPILFNTEMVKAIMDGRKTVTRRLIKPQPRENAEMRYVFAGGRKSDIGKWHDWQQGVTTAQKWNPPYHADDILYVRETWTKLFYVDPDGYTHWDQSTYYYAADGTPDITLADADGFELDDQRIKWKPSIHMPKEAARIFLKVKSVRVERLQAITNEEAVREGFDGVPCDCANIDEHGCVDCFNTGWIEPPCVSFMCLWDSTIKPADLPTYGWDANPWVWVIEFERCEKPKKEE